MHSICGKIVDQARKKLRKSSAWFSTYHQEQLTHLQLGSVQPIVFTNSFPTFPLQLSPLKVAVSPLYEHYLYPVSTAPINNSTKGN